jgi:nucleoside-diphosphate-sugar epimerase
MRILIIGGTSSLATALKPYLAEFASVITAGRNNTCDLHMDLAAEDGIPVLPSGIDIVINTAAGFGDTSAAGLLNTYATNVTGLIKLCNACTQAKVGKFIQVSSIFAGLPQDSPLYNIYALSKKHAEDILTYWSLQSAMPHVIIRPSQMYGTGAALRKHQPFFYSIIDKAARDETIAFYGNNDALRNFIHVEDVARIIALVCNTSLQGTFACMAPAHIRYSEIAHAAIAAFGSRSTITFLQDKPDIPDNVTDIDTTLFDLLHTSTDISLEKGMALEYTRRNSLS